MRVHFTTSFGLNRNYKHCSMVLRGYLVYKWAPYFHFIPKNFIHCSGIMWESPSLSFGNNVSLSLAWERILHLKILFLHTCDILICYLRFHFHFSFNFKRKSHKHLLNHSNASFYHFQLSYIQAHFIHSLQIPIVPFLV